MKTFLREDFCLKEGHETRQVTSDLKFCSFLGTMSAQVPNVHNLLEIVMPY